MLVCVVALAILTAPLVAAGTGPRGEQALIESPNGVAAVDLAQDAEYVVPSALGEMTVEVDRGVARVLNAPCPDQVCVDHQPIGAMGEVIVCVPGRVSIRVGVEGPEVDDVVR